MSSSDSAIHPEVSHRAATPAAPLRLGYADAVRAWPALFALVLGALSGAAPACGEKAGIDEPCAKASDCEPLYKDSRSVACHECLRVCYIPECDLNQGLMCGRDWSCSQAPHVSSGICVPFDESRLEVCDGEEDTDESTGEG